MSPLHDESGQVQCPDDLIESELLLSDFLHEMDEIDFQHSFTQQLCSNLQEPQELEAEVKLDFKTTPTEATTTENVSKPVPTKRRSTSWLRRKQELHALRHEVQSLELRVAFLQAQCAKKAIQQSAPVDSKDQDMWKSVATIARRECQNAQCENERLKNEVQMYTRVCEILQAQLFAAQSRHQKLHDSAMAFADTFRVGVITSRRFCVDNNEIFDMLEGKINARFHELKAIIHETREPTQRGAMERIQVCRESDQGTSPAVEFKYVRLLPFGEDITSKTIWEFVELGGLVTKANTCVARSTTDMVGLVACHLIPLRDKGSVRVNVHTVIKRFAAEAGMAALVESRSEWSIESPTTAIYRSRTEEGGWVVVHEHPMQRCGLSDNATERASQLVTAIKLRPNEPQISNSANSCSLLTSAIVDVVIPSYRDLMSSQLQSVENFLLDARRAAY